MGANQSSAVTDIVQQSAMTVTTNVLNSTTNSTSVTNNTSNTMNITVGKTGSIMCSSFNLTQTIDAFDCRLYIINC